MFGQSTSTPGEFRRVSLNESFVVQPGDLAQVVGNQVIITRAGVVVAVRLLTGEPVAVPLGAEQSEVINSVVFFWRQPMPGVVATLTDVKKNTSTGSIEFVFSDNSSRTFTGREQAMSETDYLDTDATTAQDVLIRKTLTNSPDDTNLTTCVGGKCSIDMNANNPVTLTIE